MFQWDLWVLGCALLYGSFLFVVFSFVFFPHALFTRRLMQNPLIFLIPLLINVFAHGERMPIVTFYVFSPPYFSHGFFTPSLTEYNWLRDYAGSERGFLAIYSHMMVWDLFVMRWMFWDALKHKVNHSAMLCFYFFVLALGPLGFLLYMAYRTLIKKVRFSME